MLPDGKLKPHDTIYKFDAKGNVVKSFGAGMFIWPHGLHVDREGNVWATDAAFSVSDEDLIYVYGSESDNVENPGFEQGIRIGDALGGWVKYFILDQGGNPGTTTGSGAEFGAVDKFGNVFAGEPRPRVLRKYVKVR